MKQYIGVVLSTFFSFCLVSVNCHPVASSVAPKKNKIPKARYILAIEKVKSNDSDTARITIKITFTNNTADTLRYMSMSCSWWDLYVFDKKGIYFDYGGCDKNVPKVLKLSPHTSTEIIAPILREPKTTGIGLSPFKIGFDLEMVKPGYYGNDFDKINYKNVIWSNFIRF